MLEAGTVSLTLGACQGILAPEQSARPEQPDQEATTAPDTSSQEAAVATAPTDSASEPTQDSTTTLVGWAVRDFTPQRPAMIDGQMYVRIGRDAVDPLTATALALEGSGPTARVIFVSCDIAMVSDELHEAVRARVRERLPEFPEDAVIMTATHTHDGPVIMDGVYPHPRGNVMTAGEALDWVAEQAADAAVEAWEQRVPRLMGRAFGHAVVGHNRRAVYTNGLAMMYGDTNRADFSHIEGYEDHSMDMLFVWETDGRLSGIALAIPCPAQVEESLEQFSADFWHEIRLDLRRRFGEHLHVLPLCGAAGDQSPHFLLYGTQEAEMRHRRGVTERQEIAERVGDGVERALECTQPPATGAMPMVHRAGRLTFSRRRITLEERNHAQSEYEAVIERGEPLDLWWPKRLKDVMDRFDRDEPMESVEAELHAVRIGDVALVTTPFELFLDYGLQIKARSPAAQTLVVQLAGGPGFYLPTERAIQGGDYSAHPAMAPVGGEAGRELVEAALAAIYDLSTSQDEG